MLHLPAARALHASAATGCTVVCGLLYHLLCLLPCLLPCRYIWVSICVVSTAAYLLLIKKLQDSTGACSGGQSPGVMRSCMPAAALLEGCRRLRTMVPASGGGTPSQLVHPGGASCCSWLFQHPHLFSHFVIILGPLLVPPCLQA